jgi:hypothetical protein
VSDDRALEPVVSQALVKYDSMCRAIEAAYKVDEVKDIRDKAAALEAYARQAKNVQAERQACKIRLRAERKAGQLTKKLTKAKPPGKKIISPGETISKAGQLRAAGITTKQAYEWEKLGAVPQEDFDRALGEAERPTTKGIIKATTEPKQPRVSSEALWLWGRLRDFERDYLSKDPADVMATMHDQMRDDVHTLAPRVAAWLKRIGAPLADEAWEARTPTTESEREVTP